MDNKLNDLCLRYQNPNCPLSKLELDLVIQKGSSELDELRAYDVCKSCDISAFEIDVKMCPVCGINKIEKGNVSLSFGSVEPIQTAYSYECRDCGRVLISLKIL